MNTSKWYTYNQFPIAFNDTQLIHVDDAFSGKNKHFKTVICSSENPVRLSAPWVKNP